MTWSRGCRDRSHRAAPLRRNTPEILTTALPSRRAISFVGMSQRRTSRSQEGAAWQALYNSTRWRNLRLAQLRSDPLCAMCKADGKVTPATVCDHVVPHKGNPERFFGGPFQSLCKPCHDRHKQSEERTGRPALPRGPDGWPIDA